MALIKCPECGRDISNTSKECIHCGCPLKKKTHIPKKIIVIAVGAVVLLTLILILVKGISSHTIQHTELFEIMEYKQPSSIKKILGDNYEYKTFDGGSSCEDYDDIEVDRLPCSLVEISYAYGEYERILLEASDISANEKDILVKDFIAQYSKDYDYEEDEYNGRKSFEYIWDFEPNRRISFDIHESKEDGMYWIRINSFHNWMK